jgi:hypothetical protein
MQSITLTRTCAALACWVVGWAYTPCFAQQYAFEILPNGTSISRYIPRGISGDGNVIIGSVIDSIFDNFERPYLWRRLNGAWVGQGVPSLNNSGRLVAASYDGDTIVGLSGNFYGNTTINPGTPTTWRGVLAGSPTTETPFLTAGQGGQPLRGVFTGVSANGSRVHGWAKSNDADLLSSNVYVQDMGAAPVSLNLPGSLSGTYPACNTMSADGTRATQYLSATDYNTTQLGTVWQEGVGVTYLAPPGSTGGYSYPRTTAISADGSVIAGFLGQQNNFANFAGKPAVWRDGTLSLLGFPTGPTVVGYVAGMNTTGSILVGATGISIDLVNGVVNPNYATNSYATIWIDNQAFRLRDYLIARGVAMGDLQPHYILGISADGITLTGLATRPGLPGQGRELVPFVATIPAPGVLALSGIAGLAVARRRREPTRTIPA